MFYEWLKRRERQKGVDGAGGQFCDVYLQKIMMHIKVFVTRLYENGYLCRLVPADVPRGKVTGKLPTYLTKAEL